jgi:hypothetical protein
MIIQPKNETARTGYPMRRPNTAASTSGDAADEQHERHDHGEPPLDQSLAPDLEPEAPGADHQNWMLVVGSACRQVAVQELLDRGVDGLRVRADVVLERDLLLVLDAHEVVHDVVDLLVARAGRTGCSTRASGRAWSIVV